MSRLMRYAGHEAALRTRLAFHRIPLPGLDERSSALMRVHIQVPSIRKASPAPGSGRLRDLSRGQSVRWWAARLIRRSPRPVQCIAEHQPRRELGRIAIWRPMHVAVMLRIPAIVPALCENAYQDCRAHSAGSDKRLRRSIIGGTADQNGTRCGCISQAQLRRLQQACTPHLGKFGRADARPPDELKEYLGGIIAPLKVMADIDGLLRCRMERPGHCSEGPWAVELEEDMSEDLGDAQCATSGRG